MNLWMKKISDLLSRHIDETVLVATSLLSFMPLLLFADTLQKLLWYGDDWYLLSRLKEMGVWKWCFTVFAENFVPVFKLMWTAAIYLLNGSHFAMLGLLWTTHAFTTLCFGFLLYRFRLGLPGIVLAMAMLGLAWTNVETLTWATQWSASLAVLFFIIAFHFLHTLLDRPNFSFWLFLGYTAALFASAWSFSRGVLSGVVLAVYCLFYLLEKRHSPVRLWVFAVASLVPAFVTAFLIFLFSTGNHLSLGSLSGEQILAMAKFAGVYLFLNPLTSLFRIPWFFDWNTWYIILPMVLIKIGIVFAAFLLASKPQKYFLSVFLMLDMGNAFLLGLGRYHTGLPAAMSYRYEYTSFICLGVFIAVLFSTILFRFLRIPQRVIFGTSVLLLFLAAWNYFFWRAELPHWCNYRGTVSRTLLADDEKTDFMPGIPFLNNHEAKKLAEHFNLH